MIREPATNGFVAKLAADLRVRLDELEMERTALRAALKALEPERRLRTPDSLSDRLLERIASSPGSRGSLLALEFGVPIAAVNGELHRLQDSAMVAKQGLGWVRTGSSDPTELAKSAARG